VGVCTNTLCAVLGGDEIFARLKDHLDVGNDETTEDGQVTLEHIECNAACDYAPVMTVDWEFMDDMTPESAVQLVDDLRSGVEVRSTRGPRITSWRATERVLAGFPDGRVDEGVGAGPSSLVGLAIARERGWTAPASSEDTSDDPRSEGDPAPAVPEGSSDGAKVAGAKQSDDSVAENAAVEDSSSSDETAAEKKDAT
jgi:NADH-quinone oxidoreductase subunit E